MCLHSVFLVTNRNIYVYFDYRVRVTPCKRYRFDGHYGIIIPKLNWYKLILALLYLFNTNYLYFIRHVSQKTIHVKAFIYLMLCIFRESVFHTQVLFPATAQSYILRSYIFRLLFVAIFRELQCCKDTSSVPHVGTW